MYKIRQAGKIVEFFKLFSSVFNFDLSYLLYKIFLQL